MANTAAFSGRGHGVATVLKGAQLFRRVTNKARVPLVLFSPLNRGKERFTCPICSYEGPFAGLSTFAGFRKHAVCPHCGALERHRLQYLVVTRALGGRNPAEIRMLHFAPEKWFRSMFSRQFPKYETADLSMEGVNHTIDIQNLPFKDETYDFVFASCVLEYVREDRKALGQIRRVLRPDGMAILPVPIVCAETIEYPEANPFEAGGEVRASGLDYFERYRRCFARVEVHSSGSFAERYQLFIYEDRSAWPNKACPLRPPMQGNRHADFVPVCYAR